MNETRVTYNGIGVCGALGVAFIVLKLANIIDWAWWIVLAPFWVPAALAIVGFIVFVLIRG